MRTFLRSGDGADKGAALMIVLAFVVLLTGVALAYFSRTTTDRQLAQASYTDTSSDLLARSALDIVVRDFKQDILTGQPVSPTNIEPPRYGDDASIPNLIRRSVQGIGATSTISSTSVSANGRSISTARWNNHYLIPRRPPVSPETWDTVYSDPVPGFTPPDWVLVTAQGPDSAPVPNLVIGRYAFAAYDEGGLLDMNLAGYPTWSGNVNPNP